MKDNFKNVFAGDDSSVFDASTDLSLDDPSWLAEQMGKPIKRTKLKRTFTVPQGRPNGQRNRHCSFLHRNCDTQVIESPRIVAHIEAVVAEPALKIKKVGFNSQIQTKFFDVISSESETEELLSQDIDNCILEDSQLPKKQSQHSQLSSIDSQQNSQSLFSQQPSSQQSAAKSPNPTFQVFPEQEISKIPIPKILSQVQHQDTPPIAKRANVRPRNIAAEQNAEIENWKRDVMLEIFTMRRNLTNLENQVRNHPF